VIDVRVQAADFDPGKQLARLEAMHPAAVASLTVLVPSPDSGSHVLVDHYSAMAKDELTKIATEASERWPLVAAVLVHRHGRLAGGARLAFIAAAAADRATSMEACDFLARETTRRAPFWRRSAPAVEVVSTSGR
jgi:molybdopterin synthase catalytic subunit